MRAEVAFVEFISCPLTGTAPQQPRGTEVAGAGGEKSADSMRISDLHLQSDSSTAAASCERTTLPSLAASSWAGAVIERSFQNWSVRLAVNESRTPESASRRSTMGIHNAAKRSRPQCVSFGSLSASRSSSRPWARIKQQIAAQMDALSGVMKSWSASAWWFPPILLRRIVRPEAQSDFDSLEPRTEGKRTTQRSS